MPTSITTRRGDRGETDLLLGRRVPKHHPRMQAVGDTDELNATLGLARLHVSHAEIRSLIARAQHDLVAIMGMLSAGPENEDRYRTTGFATITQTEVDRLTAEAASQEAAFPDGFKGWSTPGASGHHGSAWLEMARCVARRAERSVSALATSGQPAPPVIIAWLNRLSDLLWLCARREESDTPA
ncbi:MAG: cob(I)yrinic acid a,c-diamide adenosyltransferase [Verrucomicrobiota bacterium]|jgi:cob(I)alamin adenosyltransferase